MKHRKLHSIEDIKKLRQSTRNVNIEQKENLSKINKIALGITERVGSMGFFFIIFCWTVAWLSWNTLAPKTLKFDPYPATVQQKMIKKNPMLPTRSVIPNAILLILDKFSFCSILTLRVDCRSFFISSIECNFLCFIVGVCLICIKL